MIELAAFNEYRVALALSDYLKSEGIDNHIEVEPDRFAIHLQQDSDLSRANTELQHFLQNPNDSRYWQASWQTGNLQAVPPALEETPTGVGGALRGLWQRGGMLTLLVAVLCTLVFMALEADPTVYEQLQFPADPWHMQGQYWRLLTPVFVHYSLLHLLFNLIWWWDLGGLVERTQSRLQLLGVFLTTALASNLVQFHEAGNHFGGLSAVVYGLLGYVWLYLRVNPGMGFRLRPEIVMFMVGWLLLGYTGLLDNVIGRMANAAHTTGLLSGAALGLLFGLLHRPRQNPAGDN